MLSLENSTFVAELSLFCSTQNSILEGIFVDGYLSRAMSVATKLHSHAKPVLESREILGPGGNRDRAPEKPKCKQETLKNSEKQNKALPAIPESVIRDNSSIGSSCSSDSLLSSYSTKLLNPKVKPCDVKPVKAVAAGGDPNVTSTTPSLSVPGKRCGWITPYSGKQAQTLLIIDYCLFESRKQWI